MTKLTLALALAVTVGAVTAPAGGQTLAQRVAAIQEKHAEQHHEHGHLTRLRSRSWKS